MDSVSLIRLVRLNFLTNERYSYRETELGNDSHQLGREEKCMQNLALLKKKMSRNSRTK